MNLWSELKLDMDHHRLVTLVGGGGKTTTLYALAQEARAAGKTVVVTSTTHMMPHPRLTVTGDADPARLGRLLAEEGIVMLGTCQQNKLGWRGPLGPVLSCADIVLSEGDGARRLPLKVPADHEPVIPPETAAVLALAGMDALGKPIGLTCHRPERVTALLDKSPEDPVTVEDYIRILSSPLGARKGVTEAMAYRCVLNKTDTPALQAEAEKIVAGLAERGIFALSRHYEERERGGLCWF